MSFLSDKLTDYFRSILFKPDESQDKLKQASEPHQYIPPQRQKFIFLFTKVLVIFLLLHFVGTSFAEAPIIRDVIARITKPQPIIQSSTVLTPDIQKAIQNLAKDLIQQEQAKATLPVSSTLDVSNQQKQGLIISLSDTLQETFSPSSANRTKAKIRKIDGLIIHLRNVLTKDKSDKAVNQATKLIQEIGENTDKIVKDPQSQKDRELLTLQIEQYNRLQLIIQQLEDTLPLNNYLKIEDARKKYLVVTATAAINNAPNLDAVHNIAVKEVAQVVGDDFAELKAIEIISDFESSVKPQAQEKLLGLEKELATTFEKKMLKLPRDVRNKKLQDYIQYSFGDPLLQIRSIERMKDYMNDREIILGLNSLKELAMKRFVDRIFELDNQEAVNQYTDRVLQSLEDLKVLTEMEFAVNSGRNEERIQKLLKMRKSVEGRVAQFFASGNLEVYFKQQTGKSLDILDVLLISNLNTIVSTTPGVPNELKQKFADIKNKNHKAFIDKISTRNFVTKSTLAYNPVSANADVRVLLASPQAIQILQMIRNESSESEKSRIDTAIRTQSAILQDHMLTQVNDPETFEDYAVFIDKSPFVKQTLQTNLGQNFFTNLSKKSLVIQKATLEDRQKQYETMQQILQAIFVSKNQTDFERQLPTQIQQQISQLKKALPNKNVPQLTVPKGVNLPKVAKLSDSIEQAIVQAAKQRIKERQQSKEVKLDLTVSAKDLGVANPLILPDSPFYSIKKLIRTIALVLTFDPLQRAQVLIKQDNDKTLEAAKLLEKSSSRETINLALATLAEVEKDFTKLKENSTKLDTLRQEQPKKVELLVDQIIKNGLARQTVFSSIEDKVYGADYVRVEKIRQHVLKDGVDALLQLTGGDVQVLVQKLEQAAYTKSGSKFKELKAIELLTEIKRFQPEKIGLILEASETRLVKQFEIHLLAIGKKQRDQELLAYADSLPGNPVRQFEAYEQLKDSFTNHETLLLAEGLKDKAVENLRDKISEINDGETLKAFVDEVVGNKPEDLKIVTEIELRVEIPQDAGLILTPIEQKIEEIKTAIEENIIDTYANDPTGLSQSDLFSGPSNGVDVIDVIVVNELENILKRTPEVSPETTETIQQLAAKTTSQFIQNVSNTNVSTQVLEPVPQIIAELVALKEEVPASVDAQINVAIGAQVIIIKEYLTTQVNDPETFATYIAQIEQDPVVLQTVISFGGQEFTHVIEQTAQEVAVTAQSEQTILEATVVQIQKEIFSAPTTSEVEQTLTESVQEEIQQVKEKVPVEQIPSVTVSTTPQPTSEPVSIPPAEAPAPVIPEAKQPEETKSAPAPEAPAVPGL